MATRVDPDKLQEFMGKAVGDIGAGMSAALVLIGDRLGLYKALTANRLTSSPTSIVCMIWVIPPVPRGMCWKHWRAMAPG